MDQQKNQGQQQHGQPNTQRSGSQQTGQEQWNQTQGPNHHQDQAEGGRTQHLPSGNNTEERGMDNQQSERNVDISDSGRGGNSRSGSSDSEQTRSRGNEDSGGITNRPLDEEISEQQELPERGTSKSDRSESDR